MITPTNNRPAIVPERSPTMAVLLGCRPPSFSTIETAVPSGVVLPDVMTAGTSTELVEDTELGLGPPVITDGKLVRVLANDEVRVPSEDETDIDPDARVLRTPDLVDRLATSEARTVTNVVWKMVVSKTVTVEKGTMKAVVESICRSTRMGLVCRSAAMRLAKRNGKAVQISLPVYRIKLDR